MIVHRAPMLPSPLRPLSAGCLLVFLGTIGACAGDEALIASQSEAIVGGQETSDYPAVAEISVTTTGGDTFSCSSTLISPRVLLTAAHCLDLDEGPTMAVTAYFGTRVTGQDPGFIQSIPAVDWIFADPWSLGSDDIAMVLLEYDSDVAPLPYNTQVLGNSAIGALLHVVGWGNIAFEVGSGRKRHMSTPITGFANSSVVTYGNNNQNTCQGDSGGPGFLTFSDGIERVSSITSFGQQGCLGSSGATRVAQYADFISSWIAQNDVPQPPVVSFVLPVNNTTVKAGFQVHVEATDNTRLETVEIWINDQLQESLLGRLPPFIIATSGIPDGPVKIEARGIDNRGDVGSQIVNVTLDSTCSGPEGCSEFYTCSESGFCQAPDFGLGDVCVANEQCGSGICATVAEDQLCTQECTAGDKSSCPENFDCLNAGETGYCWPDAGQESGGCSTSGGSGAGAGGLLVMLALMWRRRRLGSI